MSAKTPYIQPFLDSASHWRFRIRAANHRVLASSEAYSSWRKCWQAVGLMHEATCLRVDFSEVESSGVLCRMRIRDFEI
ncbi:MAG TPA: YegP family protein [Candidatus Anammoximicrobium sp.]|nr:YegP family protein [Candidatus Anammoximicrobium sp.]